MWNYLNIKKHAKWKNLHSTLLRLTHRPTSPLRRTKLPQDLRWIKHFPPYALVVDKVILDLQLGATTDYLELPVHLHVNGMCVVAMLLGWVLWNGVVCVEQENTALRSLDLMCNNILTEGAERLAKSLHVRKDTLQIHFLYCSCCILKVLRLQ